MEEKANMKNGREKEGGVGKGKRKESEKDGIRQERRVETRGEGRKKWRLEREKEKREERKRKGKKEKSNPFQRLSYASDSGQEQKQIKESNYPTSKKICVISIRP